MSATKSDRERASRLRRRERKGDDLSDRDARWLARYDDARRRPAPRVERVEPPATPAATPAAPVVVAEPVDLVEIANVAPPAATPAAPGATPVATHATPPAPGSPGVPGGPLPTLHAPACTIVDCPGCAGQLATGPQTCGKTGLAVYPKLSDVAARGFASFLLWAVSTVVRVGTWIVGWATTGKGTAPAYVEPTKLERSELAEALTSIFRTRPALGAIGQAWGDVAACGAVVTAYSARQQGGGARLPADAGGSS